MNCTNSIIWIKNNIVLCKAITSFALGKNNKVGFSDPTQNFKWYRGKMELFSKLLKWDY